MYSVETEGTKKSAKLNLCECGGLPSLIYFGPQPVSQKDALHPICLDMPRSHRYIDFSTWKHGLESTVNKSQHFVKKMAGFEKKLKVPAFSFLIRSPELRVRNETENCADVQNLKL